MQDPFTKQWHQNITCPTCRHRHPATWTCQYASNVAAAQRTEREEQNAMPVIPQYEMPDPDHSDQRATARAIEEGWDKYRPALDGEDPRPRITAKDFDHDISDSERRVRTQAARVRAGLWPPSPDLVTVPLSSPRRGMSTFFISPELLGHKLNNDRTVAVSTDVFWNEDMTTCPRGAKVQLLGAGGVALYGTYNGKDSFYVGWAPVPRRRPA